jgi:phosphoglycerol transferase
MCLGVLLIVLTRKIELVFGAVSFDQVLFHLSLPRDTIDPKVIESMCRIGWAIKAFILCGGLFVCLSCLLIFRKLSLLISRFLCFFARRPALIGLLIASFVFVTGLGLFCAKLHILQTFSSMICKSQIIDENYCPAEHEDFQQRETDGRILATNEKPNLVLIVSESLESTFSDNTIFSEDLMPELSRLRKQGDFTQDLFQVNGCHYTIASMYSIHYGMPLLYLTCTTGSPIQDNVLHKNCLSIFDILDDAGYNICHLQGTSLSFAGQGALFAHLPQAKCIGVDDIPKTEYSSRQNWGLWDSDLFDKAQQVVASLVEAEKPFALSIQTIDTHSGNVLQPGQESKYGDNRDLIRLQSKLIGNFVAWLGKQPFATNTVIVILGDHNMMTKKIGNIEFSSPEKRRVFNCILNSRAGVKMGERSAAMFDYAPTILDALSFKWPSYSLGIGRSLYREKPTILETYGKEKWDSESKKRSVLYSHLVNE